jgi:hypothetical protein
MITKKTHHSLLAALLLAPLSAHPAGRALGNSAPTFSRQGRSTARKRPMLGADKQMNTKGIKP